MIEVKQRTALAIVTILLSLCLTATTAAVSLSLQHNGSTTHAWQIGAEYMSTELTRLSANRVSMMIYPAGILSGHTPPKMLNQIQTGVVDIMVESLDFFAELSEGLWSMYTPFLFDDVDHFNRFRRNIPLALVNTMGNFDDHNLALIGLWPLSFNQYLGKERTLTKPKDLTGSMMRMPPLPSFLDPSSSLGLKTVPLPASDTYTAYQLGTINGENNSIANLYEYQTFKLASYLTIWNYAPNIGLVVMNKDAWNSLPPDVQDMIIQAATEAGEVVLQQEKTVEARNVRYMIEHGVKIRQLSEPERQAFKQAVVPTWDNIGRILGEDTFEALLTAVQDAR